MAERETAANPAGAHPAISRARLAHIAAWSIDLPPDEADRACAGIVLSLAVRNA